jgi:hypothetical protein
MADGFHPIGPRLGVEGVPEFNRDMEAAGRKAEEELDRMGRGFRNAALQGNFLSDALRDAIRITGDFIASAINTATALKDQADAAGVSVEKLQVYRRAATS